jgi:N-acetylglucosamine-6-phosphate deacetylase
MIQALTNGLVLRDSGFAEGMAVLIDGTRISAVVPDDDPRVADATTHDLGGNLLLPGFIDTQVNGGGGVLFNDAPTVETIRTIGAAHRPFGTTGFLPTLISDDFDVIEKAIAAVAEAIRLRVAGVLGIHIEGPFLSPERKGAHDAEKLRRIDAAAIKLLTTPTGGRTLVTLAPEMTTPAVVRELSESGVIVAAGHTNASYAHVRAALDAGLRGFTHLFNAMSPLGSREPGAVGAALDDAASFCGIIVDGVHVDPVVLRIALRSRPHDRFVLVTDAMPNIGSDLTEFRLAGKLIAVHDDRVVDENGALAGANLTMARAVANAVKLLDLDLRRAVRMASAQPAAYLKYERVLGRIEPGYLAGLVLADEKLNVIETWIDGEHMAHRDLVMAPGFEPAARRRG